MYAKSIDTNAKFINDHTQPYTGTVYTSLGDLPDRSALLDLINGATEVLYHPWILNGDLRHQTELTMFESGRKIKYFHNSNPDTDPIIDTRRGNHPQMFAAGCSMTVGFGVDIDQRWSTLVSKHFNIDYTSLCWGGASIIWAGDQILRSDIRADDIVIWGLTHVNRYPIVHNKVKHHINPQNYTDHAQHLFDIDFFDSETLLNWSVNSVRQCYNFCQKIGAELLVLDFASGLSFRSYLPQDLDCIAFTDIHEKKFLDFGTDNIHPGPKTHQHYADTVINYIKEKPWTLIKS